MRALIVTINDDQNYNFGNKLQNLAVSVVLSKLGYSSETLNFEINNESVSLKEICKRYIMRASRYKLARNEQQKFYWRYGYKRKQNFKLFRKKYLKQHTDFGLQNSTQYDYYVIGSDQVWNPEFFKYHNMKKNAYLLTFCENEKKICFSPSFGISEIPDEWKLWFEEHLSKIPNISVREREGLKIVKNLTGKDAEVLIDPTLMLTYDQWREYSRKPKNINVSQKYMLTYFLGEMSKKHKEYIFKIAESNNLKTFNLLDREQPELYISGPSEFLYLIMNSELVVTDSFHACVFSFIFNKPFLVFDRNSEYSDMSSRIDTLLEKFDLNDRRGELFKYDNLFEVDYTNGYVTLEQERKKVIDFLKKSMRISNED